MSKFLIVWNAIISLAKIVTSFTKTKKDEQVVFNPTTLINLYKDKTNSPKKRDKLFDIILLQSKIEEIF